MSRPVVALLTDFGLRDHYAGTMKGVVLGVCPDATCVDITHEIPAHDVLAAALELTAAAPHFPKGTVFLVVIDPGVGTARRGLAAMSRDRYFVGPDNGVLSLVLDADPAATVVSLPPMTFASVFEGRDRFAPAAGRLACGAALQEIGEPMPAIQRLALPPVRAGKDLIEGEVIRVDRFGNLMTNITGPLIEGFGRPLLVEIAGVQLRDVVRAYGDVPPGAPCAVIDSSGRLEVAMSAGNAAARLSAGRGTPVRVRRGASPVRPRRGASPVRPRRGA